jgi:RHS repeat-associated protein
MADNSAVQTYYLQDGLGSTTGLTDGSGGVTDSYTYDVFGALRSQAGTSANPYRFTGEQNDPTGLEYLRARYYDPALGRFLSRDLWPASAVNPQSRNRYIYVYNNPLRYVARTMSGSCAFWHTRPLFQSTWPPAVSTLSRSLTSVSRQQTKMSSRLSVSPGTRWRHRLT